MPLCWHVVFFPPVLRDTVLMLQLGLRTETTWLGEEKRLKICPQGWRHKNGWRRFYLLWKTAGFGFPWKSGNVLQLLFYHFKNSSCTTLGLVITPPPPGGRGRGNVICRTCYGCQCICGLQKYKLLSPLPGHWIQFMSVNKFKQTAVFFSQYITLFKILLQFITLHNIFKPFFFLFLILVSKPSCVCFFSFLF